jgi:GNAT superfamily N-acetyltransferase
VEPSIANAHAHAFRIRLARDVDVPMLEPIVEASVRGLQTGEYTAVQIERALEKIYGIDRRLIADGTYYVAESTADAVGATIIACGGWSRRTTLYGGDRWSQREDSLLDPQTDAAKIRAFFVLPQWARRGVGRAILHASEAAASAAGFTRFEIGATLTGVALYEAHGYRVRDHIEIALDAEVVLPIARMWKTL